MNLENHPLQRFGVFIHFLSKQPGTVQSEDDQMDAEKWNRIVDNFDVDGLSKQLSALKANHLIFTITQLSGYMCTPNKIYDELSGITPRRLSRRDLISDLINALKPYGIRLFLYLGSEGPCGDPDARKAFDITSHWSDIKGFKYPENDNPVWGKFKKPEYTKKWLQVIREWSLRYGDDVSGWWIDGAYGKDFRFPDNEEVNLKLFTDTLKAGNPDALVSYNSGLEKRLIGYTIYNDYTSGEFAWSLPEINGPFIEFKGKQMRTHVLSYLGKTWCNNELRFPTALVKEYTKYAINKGGTVTWDTGINQDGTIDDGAYKVLKELSGY